MAGDRVIRPRPPTLRPCPAALDSIHLYKSPNLATYELTFPPSLDDAHEELPRAIWYALGDVFAAAASQGNQSINLSPCLDRLDAGKMFPLLQSLFGNETSGDFTVTRSWWYQSYNKYAYGSPPAIDEPKDESDKVKDDQSDDMKVVSKTGLPQRPPQNTLPPPPQPFYERYIAPLDSYFCMSLFGNSDPDIDLLHNWLNDPRVDEFWKDAGTRDEHVKWLENRYIDPHVLPVLGSYRATNGDQSTYEPFAYYEIYWAADDKIASFYPSEPYDRGIHMLVGSSTHRGPHRVKSWLPSLVHYIFNDEPRTSRVISEPNHKNLKMIRYLESFGFKKVNEVDVGHKVAAIMILDKCRFWETCPI